MGRPHPWERSYPPGVRWDAPIACSTLPELLDRAVAAFGERTAIEFRDRPLTYAALGREVGRFAAACLANGIGPGRSLALYLPNTVYHPVSFFGGAKAGARLVHLSPLDAERELAHKLKDSGARSLVTTDIGPLLPLALKLLDAGHLDRVIVGEDALLGPSPVPPNPVPERPGVMRFQDFLAAAEGSAPSFPALTPDDVALLQYTGGTTGLPKGAILTHGNLTAAVEIYEAWYGGQNMFGGGRTILVLPLFHIYGLTCVLLRGIRVGAELLLRLRFDVETTLRDIEDKRAASFPGVPTMWIAIANHPGLERRDLSSLTYCASGGAPLPVEVASRFERLTGHKLGGGWGMTETAPAGTNLPKVGPMKPGTIGLPLPGIEMKVVALDDPARALRTGETGELAVRGPNVTRGYWNRPEESEAAFAGDWFLTGDIGFMDQDGYFFIVDRKKDMILSGGFNVYPQMIEQAIYEHPAVAEVAVVGVPDDYRGEAAKAFVKLRDGAAPFTLDELKAFLGDKLGRHEMPAALEIRDALPRTPVGKLSKVELRAAERLKAAHRTSAAPVLRSA